MMSVVKVLVVILVGLVVGSKCVSDVVDMGDDELAVCCNDPVETLLFLAGVVVRRFDELAYPCVSGVSTVGVEGGEDLEKDCGVMLMANVKMMMVISVVFYFV